MQTKFTIILSVTLLLLCVPRVSAAPVNHRQSVTIWVPRQVPYILTPHYGNPSATWPELTFYRYALIPITIYFGNSWW